MNLKVKVRLEITGKDSDMIVKSLIDDHSKFMKCRRLNDSFHCTTEGNANDVRKTLNEFFESLIFLEEVSKAMDARVG